MSNEDNKRKSQTSNEDGSPQKIRKATPSSSRFINTMISQWSKRTGTQFPSTHSQSSSDKVSQTEAEQYAEQKYKIQILQKKLQTVEEAKVSLTASLETEAQNRNEIMEKLNTTWKSIDAITNYYNYISESLLGFQQHTADLSTLYDSVISVQSSTLTKLEDQLKSATEKVAEYEKTASEAETKAAIQEKRLEQLIGDNDELKGKIKDYEINLTTEINKLLKLQEREKEEFRKERETITSENEELKQRLTKTEEEKTSVLEQLAERNESNTKFQDEISHYKDRVNDLLSRNEELSNRNELTIKEKDELTKELETRLKRIKELQDDLEAKVHRENELLKRTIALEERIFNETRECSKLQQELSNARAELKQQESLNDELRKAMECKDEENRGTVLQLNARIESLEKEKEDLLARMGSSTQELDAYCKSLQKKHQEEISVLQQEYESGISKSEKILSRYRKDTAELNATLTNLKEENKTLNDKYSQVKKDSDELHKKLKTYLETIEKKSISEIELKDKCARYETELKIINEKYKEVQEKLESQTNELKRMQADTTLKLDDFQKTKSSLIKPILKSPKKITFDVTSSSEESVHCVSALSCEERFEDLYQTITATQSQPEPSISTQKDKEMPGKDQKKFFKSRITRPKTYATPKKK